MRLPLIGSLPCLISLLLVCGCTRQTKPEKTIHQAAEEGDVAALAEHLQQRHPVDATDEAGQTPLLLAVQGGHADAVRFLLDHKAAPQTALVPAIRGGQTKLVALLVDRGADVNARAADGSSPLGAALGDPAMEALLREYGARLPPQEALRGLFKHLDVIAALMMEYKTDCQGAEQEIRSHVDKHRAEITAMAKALKATQEGLSESEREELKKVTQQMTASLLKKLMVAFQDFAVNCPQQMQSIGKTFEAFSGS